MRPLAAVSPPAPLTGLKGVETDASISCTENDALAVSNPNPVVVDMSGCRWFFSFLFFFLFVELSLAMFFFCFFGRKERGEYRAQATPPLRFFVSFSATTMVRSWRRDETLPSCSSLFALLVPPHRHARQARALREVTRAFSFQKV